MGIVTEYPQVEFYQDSDGEFRWRIRARNGCIIATSGEGYARRSGCKKAFDRLVSYLVETTLEIIHDPSWKS